MRHALRWFAVCLGAGMIGLASTAAAQPAEPFELMRSLQSLQDQVAAGNVAALGAQPKLIARLAERFAAADPQVWRSRKNAQAAASYLFSGGHSSVGRVLLDRSTLSKEDAVLINGAFAYSEGRDDDAKEILLPLDASSLPALLGAHLALVQATLVGKDDPAKAVKLLDLARLLAPGTLVEEAALRREIFLVGDRKDEVRFAALSRQYARRFRHSVYADNFRERLRSTVKAIGRGGNFKQLPEIETLTTQLEPDEQRKLYLSVARNAVLNNRSTVAGFAAERASVLAPKGSPDAARADLYSGAAMLMTDRYAAGVEKLAHVDRAHLAERDGQLYEAVTSVSKILRQPLGSLATSRPRHPGDAGDSAGERSSAVVEHATRALADVDALLKSAPR